MASDKLRSVNSDKGEELEVDMSPMIDMVFLLLIFFIVVSSQVIVKQDPNVKTTIAKNSVKPDDKHGRIVVNIYVNDSGETKWSREDKTILDDESAVKEYVNEARLQLASTPHQPKLHLRVSQDVEFKESQKVIRAASDSMVNQVVFASYPRKK